MFMTKSRQYWQILAMTIFMISAFYAQPKSRKCDKFVIFSVFSFGCLGRKIVQAVGGLHDFFTF